MKSYFYIFIIVALYVSYPNFTEANNALVSGIAALMKEGWTLKTEILPSGEMVVTEAEFLNGVLPSMTSVKLLGQLGSVKNLTCRVSDDLLKEIATIPTIRKIKLFASSRVDGNPEDHFSIDSLNHLAQNQQIEEIRMTGGIIPPNSFLDLAAFAKFSSLKTLSLTKTCLRAKDLEAIAVLPVLETLELDASFVETTPKSYLANPNIRHLTLHFWGFCVVTTDIKLFAELANESSLKTIKLLFNYCDLVNDISLEEVARIRQLREIEIRCGVFPKDIIEKLFKGDCPPRLSIVSAVPVQQVSLSNDCPLSTNSPQSDGECLDECRSEEPDVEDLSPEIRTWNSANGKFQTKAKYVSSTETQVTLEKKDGDQTTVDIEKLSAPDREYVRRRAAAEKRE